MHTQHNSMNQLQRISRKQLAGYIAVSPNTLRKILYAYKCSFTMNKPGRPQLLNLNEVAEAICKLHHLFEQQLPAHLITEAQSIYQKNTTTT